MDEFEKELELDLYHLDEAYLDLPALTEKWNNAAVEADIFAMNLKNRLDDAKAFHDQKIRENPENYGLSKLTEGTVASAIANHPDVIRGSAEYFEALSQSKRIKSKCASIATKEKALQGLTKLYEAGYFASKPICALASTISQEKERTKLNNETNKSKLRKASSH
jgi:hypothetical protein